MPATATITSFYTFQISTRLRIGGANNNFANFRGHLIPIDPNTAAAAASGQYGFGAPEYRFRTAYMHKLDLSVTSTTSLILESPTTGEYHFRANSVTGFYIGTSGFNGYDETTFPGATTSAGLSGFALKAVNAVYTGTASDVTAGLISIQTNGRPVMLGFIPMNNTTGSAYLGLVGTTAGVSNIMVHVGFKRNDVVVNRSRLLTPWLVSNNVGHQLPPGMITVIDTPPAGIHTYQLFHTQPETVNSDTLTAINMNAMIEYVNLGMFAYEL